MSDDTRRHYDRTASDWWTACEAISAAAGPAVTIPTLHLATILHGYQQLQAEREAALKRLDDWQRTGLIDNMAALHMWHALGVISQEEWDGHVASASAAQPSDGDPSELMPDRAMPWLALVGSRVTATYADGRTHTGPLLLVTEKYLDIKVNGDSYTPDLSAVASVVATADPDREGCEDHLPNASETCADCARSQGVTQ